MGKLIDLTGKRFGKLVVLQRSEKNINGRPAWICKCDCGNIKIVQGKHLRNGDTKSCGCLVHEKNSKIHKKQMQIGSRWGHWTILKEVGLDKFGVYQYECQCDCGTIKNVAGTTLRSGQSTSCGSCVRNSLPGKKFGLLTIININKERTDNKNIYVDCICECGNKTTTQYSGLKKGTTKSCGCLKQSFGQYRTKQILSQAKIPYETQKTFETCRFPDTNRLAFFDFYVDNKYIIQIDGEQHFYKSCQFFSKGFQKTRQHDIFKNEWCKNNNIPIIRIPFTQNDKLTLQDLLLETSTFILKDGDSYFQKFQT